MRWFVGFLLVGVWLAWLFLVEGVDPVAVADMSVVEIRRLGLIVLAPLVLIWVAVAYAGLSMRLRAVNATVRELQREVRDLAGGAAPAREVSDAAARGTSTRRRSEPSAIAPPQPELISVAAPVPGLRPTVTGTRMAGSDLIVEFRNEGSGAREMMISADRGVQAGISPREGIGADETGQILFRTLSGDFPGRIGFDVSFRDAGSEVSTESFVFVVADGRIRVQESAPSLSVEARVRR